MIYLEKSRHSFVITLWAVDLEPADERALWRGHITHVLTKHRQYVQSLEDISQFIAMYIKQMDNCE